MDVDKEMREAVRSASEESVEEVRFTKEMELRIRGRRCEGIPSPARSSSRCCTEGRSASARSGCSRRNVRKNTKSRLPSSFGEAPAFLIVPCHHLSSVR